MPAIIPTLVALASVAQAGRIVGRDSTISTSQTDSSYNGRLGTAGQTTSIAPGVLYWINGGSTHNFYGNIYNQGSIYVSQTAWLKNYPYSGGQTSDMTKSTSTDGIMTNLGLIQLNDYGSASAPTYDWYLRTLTNSGIIQFCGRGDTGGSTYQIFSDNDSKNTGFMSFEQSGSNKGASFVWRNSALSTSSSASNLYNEGTFRLINTVFHNVQNIYGSGCWQIDNGGVLYLEDGSGVYQNPNNGPTFPSQSIAFTDPTAVLHLDSHVYSDNSNFGPQIYGFSTGNAIEFEETIKSFSYSSGILSVTMTTGRVVYIKMGPGYTASNFVSKRNPQQYNTAGYNAIFYNGAAPSQSIPRTCSDDAPVCKNLGSNPPSQTTSDTSTTSTTSTSSKTSTSTSTTTSTSSTSSTSSKSTSQTSSSSSTTSATPTPVPSPYLGCYTDSIAARGIDDFPRLVNNNGMTVQVCQAYCSQYNALIYGLEYGQECYCGNSLKCPSVKAAESDCSTSCSGDSNQMCGNGNRLNVYGTFPSGKPPSCTDVSVTSTTVPITTALPTTTSTTQTKPSTTTTSASSSSPAKSTYTCAYQGCFTDNVNNRALNDYPRLVSTTTMSVEVCQSYCSQYSAAFYGVEYGTECYCGNSLLGGSSRAAESDCSFVCPGNALETCGAGDRLNVYGCNGAMAPKASTTSTFSSSTTAPVTATPPSTRCSAAPTVTVTVTR